jgi:hypothetical protein
MNRLTKSAKIERRQIVEYSKKHPDLTLKQLGKLFDKSESCIQRIMVEARNYEIPIFVVASECEENLYFVFNGINERKLHTDFDKFVLNGYHFNQAEKEQIRKLGFKI